MRLLNEMPLSLLEFLGSYNKNMPASFPRATAALLEEFQEEHPTLFKRNNMWSLDQHRKKVLDWLPRKRDIS